MQAGLRQITMTLLAIWLSGCGPKPECPVTEQPLPAANAGCLVIHQGRVLMVRELSGKISLPGGTSEAGETAQCTAWRETFEETGYRVHVGRRQAVFVNGFNLFRCEPETAPTGDTLSPGQVGEIREVLWLKPAQLSDYSWRFPAQETMIRHWLGQASAH